MAKGVLWNGFVPRMSSPDRVACAHRTSQPEASTWEGHRGPVCHLQHEADQPMLLLKRVRQTQGEEHFDLCSEATFEVLFTYFSLLHHRGTISRNYNVKRIY